MGASVPLGITELLAAAARRRSPSPAGLERLLGAVRALDAGGAEVPGAEVPGAEVPGAEVPGAAVGGVDARLAAITPVLDALTDPSGAVRRHLEATLPEMTGFHPRMIRLGLGIQAERLRPAALAAMLAGPHPRLARPRRRTVIVHAGNVPMLAALDVVVAVLCGDPVVVKTASREPESGIVAAELLCRATGTACAAGVSWPRGASDLERHLLGWAERLIVYGSDRAVSELGARWRHLGGSREELIAFGHKISAAWVPADGFPIAELARRLAVDTALWDQDGCLSPHVVLVDRRVDAVALGEALGEALGTLAERIPRGERTLEERAATRAWLSRVEARALSGAGDAPRIWRHADGAYTVVLDDASPIGPSPLGRAIRMLPVGDEREMLARLRGWPLQAIGLGDDPARHAHLVSAARALGATRLCAVGRMQQPGPGWIGEEPDRAGRTHVALETEVDGMWRALFADPDTTTPAMEEER